MKNLQIPLKVGSRGSRLALVQVAEVFSLLDRAGTKLSYRQATFQTQGDRDKTTSLTINPADNFFTDALDQALLNREIDVAVHSAKDLPKQLPDGLSIFAVTSALDETDAFVGRMQFDTLPPGSRVGTSSILRRDILKNMNPQLEVVDIRGTIEERLALVEQRKCDGVIVATCALKRLGLDHLIQNIMPWEATPLQGQLAVVGRAENILLAELFSAIDVRRTYGKVLLVGAGPGDPELITLKGINALKNADSVLYDYLVDPALLQYAPQAEKIYAGKRKGSHTISQPELSKMLRDHARAGKNVVRLKGGDPLVFGRGADEIDYLRSYHISVEVIPGVSSATGIPSLLGIPLTARGVSSSVTFLSGHTKEGENISEEIFEIPKTDTLVFLMGLTRLALIVRSLRKAGWREETPILVISKGTRRDEKIASGNLLTIEEAVRKEHIEPPALIVVGEVVRFRQDLSSRKQILYLGTHPEKYRPLGEIVHVPMIEIKQIPFAPAEAREILSDLARYQLIILTSRFAVKFFMEIFQAAGRSPEVLRDTKIAVIGRETAAVLRTYQLEPAIQAAVETSEGLLEAIKTNGPVRGHKILFPRSALPNPYLKEQLVQLGAEITELTVYENVPSAHSDFPAEEINKVIFTSPSTVKNFLDTYGLIPRHWRILSKGPRTSEALREAGYESEVLVYE